jgi:excisionase family DNA binding protein
MTDTPGKPADDPVALLPGRLSAMPDTEELAAYCNCSPRHINRMRDGNLMPQPIRLGRLIRWRREDIEKWVAQGCKPVRK